MYDSKEVQLVNEARALVQTIRTHLSRGIKHYRISDGRLLITVEEIFETLLKEDRIELIIPGEHHE